MAVAFPSRAIGTAAILAWTTLAMPAGPAYAGLDAVLEASGDEVQLNVATSGSQQTVAVEALPDGGFVVAWGTTYGNAFLRARRLSSDGAPIGADFLVPELPDATINWRPDVAATTSGSFLVAWDQISSDVDVVVRHFEADATPTGSETMLNTYTTGDQGDVELARAGERVLAVWTSEESDDDPLYSIQGRWLDTEGIPDGPQFLVNTHTPNFQYSPEVAATNSGDFVVVWTDYSIHEASVRLQRFASSGGALGGELVVAASEDGEARVPVIAQGQAGEFLVAWREEFGVDDIRTHARRLSALGVPLGSEFELAATGVGTNWSAQLLPGPGGSFVVVSSSGTSYTAGTDGDLGAIDAYLVRGNERLGVPVLVNERTDGPQLFPAAARSADGHDIFVAWQTATKEDGDPSGYAIAGRLIRIRLIFDDGFESGNANAWSLAYSTAPSKPERLRPASESP